MELPNFVYGSYETQAYTGDAERTVNWYPERVESPGGTSRWQLCPTPGLELIADSVAGIGQGHFQAAGREFAVISGFLYEIFATGAPSPIGGMTLGTTPATISYNGDGGGQLFITSGGNGFIYDLGSGALTQIVALNGRATMGAHLDGYFLALDANTSTLYISNLLAGLTWSTGTDFAQRSQASDPWVSMRVQGKYIWLLGNETSEVWYNTGASFPFAPHPSGLVSYGCAAPFSAVSVGSALCWLGTSVAGGIYALQASGFSPEVISSVPLQLAMSGYATTGDAEADSYTDLGHTFYIVSFPTEDITWAYDVTTGQWTERRTWIQEAGRYGVWRPRWHAWAFGEHRMLDCQTGAHYKLTTESATDVSEANIGSPFTRRQIRRLRRSPTLMLENQRIYFSGFEVDLEPGLGLATGQGSDPQVMLRISNDGGKTWGAEMWRSAGPIGAYSKRVRWNRLGMGRRRVHEVVVADPIPWRLTNAYVALGQQPQRQGTGRSA